MQKPMPKYLLTLLLTLGGILTFPSSFDDKSMRNIDDSLNRALQSFALARSLNAIISATQGTEISVEPLGIGITLTPGQVLDPVNDLIERFSWVMLASSTSIGIQKIFLEISMHRQVRLLLISIFLVTLTIIWIPGIPKIIEAVFLKASFILIFLRLSVPAVVILNEQVYTLFLSPHYQESTTMIENQEQELETLANEINVSEKNIIKNDSKSFLDTFKPTSFFEPEIEAIKAKTKQLKQKITKISDQISKSVINLIALFIIKTIFFPLLFLLILYKVSIQLSQIKLH